MSDADVERLFSELKRIDSDKTADEYGFEAEASARNLDEEKALDLWRIFCGYPCSLNHQKGR